MTEYISIAHRQRSDQFDELLGATLEALANPELQTNLLAADRNLEPAVRGLFLPNEQHGVLSRPKGLDDKTTFAMVPLSSGANGLKLDRSLLLQTQQRESDNRLGLREDHAPVKVRPLGKFNMGQCVTMPTPGDERYISQPIIYVRSSLATARIWRGASPSVVVHETQHALDNEACPSSTVCRSEQFAVASEMRAYHAGAKVAESQKDLSLASAFICRQSVRIDLERQLRTNPDGPFEPNPKMIRYMKLRQLV